MSGERIRSLTFEFNTIRGISAKADVRGTALVKMKGNPYISGGREEIKLCSYIQRGHESAFKADPEIATHSELFKRKTALTMTQSKHV